MTLTPPYRFGLIGAGGRMGAALIKTLIEGGQKITAASERAEHPSVGRDIGLWGGKDALGITIGSDPRAVLDACDIAIDFTRPDASVEHAQLAASMGRRLVIGTTGFSTAQDQVIAQYATKTPIVKSGSFALGIAVMARLVEITAKALDQFDLEILEMHHRHKVDAPSGTALLIGNAAARGRALPDYPDSVRARDGVTGPRPDGAIGYQALRGGTVVGEHTFIAAGPHERLEIKHIAEDRTMFANGAIKAALWLGTKGPGLYNLDDVLGLSS